MPWVRPSNVPIGRVWSRFNGTKGKEHVTYQIRDMGEYKDQCIKLMLEAFLRDEPLCDVLDIKSDPVSVEQVLMNWEGFVSQNVSIACFTEKDGEPDELVGFNILIVKSIDDEEEDLCNIKGENWKKLQKILTVSEELVDIFKYYNVDKYLTSSGLVVLPEHRGQNLGARMFEAREAICKEFGIQVSATVFTALTSQVLAAKCGFELLEELDYKDMMKYGIDLSKISTPTAQVRAKKY